MSGLLTILIFGVGYPVVALAVACVGVFGLAATKPDRVRYALDNRQYAGDFWFRQAYWSRLFPLLWAIAGTSLLWPMGIPIYLAWRKGSFIADALEKRDEQLRLDKAAS